MNQCDYKTMVTSYDAHQHYDYDSPLRDYSRVEVQCLLPYGHVGDHVCRVGDTNIPFPNKEMPTEEGILMEWYRRDKAGKPTDDLAEVIGLSKRFASLAKTLGVTGKAAHRAIARELTKRSDTTEEARKKRLIKI